MCRCAEILSTVAFICTIRLNDRYDCVYIVLGRRESRDDFGRSEERGDAGRRGDWDARHRESEREATRGRSADRRAYERRDYRDADR